LSNEELGNIEFKAKIVEVGLSDVGIPSEDQSKTSKNANGVNNAKNSKRRQLVDIKKKD
jgi:hypothetical protein